jgi:hypothetical protein
MYPPLAAELLRGRHGHDAVHVAEVGLRGAEDSEVAASARAGDRVLVTENVADFAIERDIVLVFVRKRRLPAGKAQAAALADVLSRWARANPEPYVGPHWPNGLH